jgi:hypothetical protein
VRVPIGIGITCSSRKPYNIKRRKSVININLKVLAGEKPRLSEWEFYKERLDELICINSRIVLSGDTQIWLLLKVVQHLQGRVKSLSYKIREDKNLVLFDKELDL